MIGSHSKVVKAISAESYVAFIALIGFFCLFARTMGLACVFGTMMKTAHDILLNTCFFIAAVCILAGAVSSILCEFGVLSLVNKVLSPLMKPLYDLPGAASVGLVATYLSDNPAIITLASEKSFRKYFKQYQFISLTNFGTAYGMGLIVGTFMIAQGSLVGESFIWPVICGTIGAVFGSIVSTRLMQHYTKKEYGVNTEAFLPSDMGDSSDDYDHLQFRKARFGGTVQRFMEAMLDGGKTGFDTSMMIVPGVTIICTIVMMLANGPGPDSIYTGAAYEGIGIIPIIGYYANFVLKPLLGFSDPSAIAFPLTAIGAVGAAIGLVPQFLRDGRIGAHEIAVFMAIGMCWSGYISTHVAMMEALNSRKMAMKAIICHTIGGFMAGVFANILFQLVAALT